MPLLSREAVYSGDFDRPFTVDVTRHGADQFDDYFPPSGAIVAGSGSRGYSQQVPGLSAGRADLCGSAISCHGSCSCASAKIAISNDMRHCAAWTVGNSFDALMTELRRADAFYDSGIIPTAG